MLISILSGSCFSLAALKFENVHDNIQKCGVVLFMGLSSMLMNAPAHHYQKKEFDFITLIIGHIYPQQKPTYVIGIAIMDGWLYQQGRAQGWNRKAVSSQRWWSL